MSEKPTAASVELSADGQNWAHVVALHSRINNEVERALQRSSHLGFTEFMAMLALNEQPDGELRMQELAEKTSLNQSSATRLVGRLERTGLTERRMCEFDRRGVYTGITDSGREALREAIPVYEKALAQAFNKASVEDEFRSLLDAIRTPKAAT